MLTTVFTLALLVAAEVAGHPVANLATGRQLQKRKINFDAYRLKTEATYVASDATPGINAKLVKRADYVETATNLVKKVAPDATFRVVTDSYIGTNGIGHVHFKQTAHELDIDNADFNVNVSALISICSLT